MPFRHCWPWVVVSDGRLNVDVDGDVGGERSNCALQLSATGEQSGSLGEICIGWERIFVRWKKKTK